MMVHVSEDVERTKTAGIAPATLEQILNRRRVNQAGSRDLSQRSTVRDEKTGEIEGGIVEPCHRKTLSVIVIERDAGKPAGVTVRGGSTLIITHQNIIRRDGKPFRLDGQFDCRQLTFRQSRRFHFDANLVTHIGELFRFAGFGEKTQPLPPVVFQGPHFLALERPAQGLTLGTDPPVK